MRVRELAEWLGSGFEGDGETEITAVAPIELAGPADITFINSRKAAQQAKASTAGCLIVPMDLADRTFGLRAAPVRMSHTHRAQPALRQRASTLSMRSVAS